MNVLLVIFILDLAFVTAYPDLCTCAYQQVIGATQMGATNTASPIYAVSAMTSAGVALADGDSVPQCSTLTITTAPPIQEGVNYVMESTLGKFTDPYVYTQYVCEYSRTNNQAGVPLTHTLYLTKSGPASIYFGWAVADSTVYISPSLALTVTPSATGNCSTVTTNPATSSGGTTAGSSGADNSYRAAVGVVIVFGVLFSLLAASIFRDKGTAFFTLANTCACFAVAMALVSAGLVLSWASSGPAPYLGSPDLSANPLPYHPAFMVCLVFTMQIARYVLHEFLVEFNIRYVDNFLLLLLLIGVIVALATVNIYKNPTTGVYANTHSPALTTVHSWIGLWAVILLLLQVLWGVILQLCELFAKEIHAAINGWQTMDFWVPLLAFFTTSVAIITGISDQLSQNVCVPTGTADYANAATNVYNGVPIACKIANGLGISVVFAALFTGLMVKYRLIDAAAAARTRPVDFDQESLVGGGLKTDTKTLEMASWK